MISKRTQRLFTLYLLLLVLLASLGAISQHLLTEEHKLLGAQTELRQQRGDLLVGAARVNGPLAVRAWAEAHGMVPIPESQPASTLPAVPPPPPQPSLHGLELRTLWH
jgi:hypothetical protein